MVKNTQKDCLSVFDHFVGLTFNGLNKHSLESTYQIAIEQT